MSDIKLFRTLNGQATEIAGSAVSLEKSLQRLIEDNLEPLLGVRFLASEHSTGKRHGGRIDTLGIDEDGSPVIIEYKRTVNENVINQGLFYLDWLMDHKAEFKLLVIERLGDASADSIEWSAPRLLCIAGDFTKYDEHAVQQMNRNIELIRYRRFGEDLLLLELVNATTAHSTAATPNSASTPAGQTYKTIHETISELKGGLKDLYEDVTAFVMALGDDVQAKELKYYVAFKRLKNFACLEIRPSKDSLIVVTKVDPETVQLEDGFTRDMRGIGHYGTGDLEITIRSPEDLERAKPLVERSYESS